eukprot:tig00021583_g22649.t1
MMSTFGGEDDPGLGSSAGTSSGMPKRNVLVIERWSQIQYRACASALHTAEGTEEGLPSEEVVPSDEATGHEDPFPRSSLFDEVGRSPPAAAAARAIERSPAEVSATGSPQVPTVASPAPDIDAALLEGRGSGEPSGDVHARCNSFAIAPDALRPALDFALEFNRIDVKKIETHARDGAHGQESENVLFHLVLGEGDPKDLCDAFVALSTFPEIHRAIEQSIQQILDSMGPGCGEVELMGCRSGSVVVMFRVLFKSAGNGKAFKEFLEQCITDGRLAEFFKEHSKNVDISGKFGGDRRHVDAQQYHVGKGKATSLADVRPSLAYVESSSSAGTAPSAAAVGRRDREDAAEEDAQAKVHRSLHKRFNVDSQIIRPEQLKSPGELQRFYTFEDAGLNRANVYGVWGVPHENPKGGRSIEQHIVEKLNWPVYVSEEHVPPAPASFSSRGEPQRAVLIPFKGFGDASTNMSTTWDLSEDNGLTRRPLFIGPSHPGHTVEASEIEQAEKIALGQIVSRANASTSYGVVFVGLQASYIVENYMEALFHEMEQLKGELRKKKSGGGAQPKQLRAGREDAEFRKQFKVDKYYLRKDKKWAPISPDDAEFKEKICILYQMPNYEKEKGTGRKTETYFTLENYFFQCCSGGDDENMRFEFGGSDTGILRKLYPGLESGGSRKTARECVVLILLEPAPAPQGGSGDEMEVDGQGGEPKAALRFRPRRAFFVNELSVIPAEKLLREKTCIWAFTEDRYKARVQREDPDFVSDASLKSKPPPKDGMQFCVDVEEGSLAEQWDACAAKLRKLQDERRGTFLELGWTQARKGERKSTRHKEASFIVDNPVAQALGIEVRNLPKAPLTLGGGTGGGGTHKSSSKSSTDFDEEYWKAANVGEQAIAAAGGRNEDAQVILSAVFRTIQDPKSYENITLESLGSTEKLRFARRAIKQLMDQTGRYSKGIFGRGSKGILLYGPPGIGKTQIIRAIAKECKATFFLVTRGTIFSKWTGVAEASMETLFCIARHRAPSIIFIDELESLASNRTENSHDSQIVNVILQQIDGFVKTEQSRILIVAATNHREYVDQAMLDRLPNHIELKLPTEEDLKRVLLADIAEADAAKDLVYKFQLSVKEIDAFCKEAAGKDAKISYRGYASVIKRAVDESIVNDEWDSLESVDDGQRDGSPGAGGGQAKQETYLVNAERLMAALTWYAGRQKKPGETSYSAASFAGRNAAPSRTVFGTNEMLGALAKHAGVLEAIVSRIERMNASDQQQWKINDQILRTLQSLEQLVSSQASVFTQILHGNSAAGLLFGGGRAAPGHCLLCKRITADGEDPRGGGAQRSVRASLMEIDSASGPSAPSVVSPTFTHAGVASEKMEGDELAPLSDPTSPPGQVLEAGSPSLPPHKPAAGSLGDMASYAVKYIQQAREFWVDSNKEGSEAGQEQPWDGYIIWCNSIKVQGTEMPAGRGWLWVNLSGMCRDHRYKLRAGELDQLRKLLLERLKLDSADAFRDGEPVSPPTAAAVAPNKLKGIFISLAKLHEPQI